MPFTGFPESGLRFFAELAAHNEKEWFEAHRAVWDDEIAPAMLAWCEELKAALASEMPQLVFNPRPGGSLLRLNRDVRFSRDKRPYETHAEALLWEGREKTDAPGFAIRVGEEVVFAGGLALFEEGRLDRYRKLLHNDASATRLEEALAAAKKGGLAPDGEKLPRPPRGFDPEAPRSELARYKGLLVRKSIAPGAWLFGREALDRSVDAARACVPLHAWMRDELCR